MKKAVFLLFFLSLVFFFLPRNAFAYSMTHVSDTVTTSRPSVAAPLNADVLSSDTSVNMYMLNNTNETYMASDAAKFLNDTGESLDVQTIATLSAISSNLQTLYFSKAVGHTHHKGDIVIVPITTMHQVSFTVNTALIATDLIKLQFPALASVDTNTASPSATGFQFNGLTSGNVKFVDGSGTNICTSINISGTGAGGTPTITCTVNSTGVAANGQVYAFIGCSGTSGTTCSTQVPTLVNPTKLAAIGSSDSWSVLITNTDSSSTTVKDTGKAIASTVESVQVNAAVDEYLTITIAGVADGSSVCNDGLTNSGFRSTSTSVNLGTLTTSVTRSAQTITVLTNAFEGYTVTSTASGQLMAPATGYVIPNAQGLATANNTPAPAAIIAGTAAFGIHPCGTDTPTSGGTPDWGGNTGGSANLFANPFSLTPLSFYFYTLATRSTAITSGSGNITTIEYGATITNSTPAGNYQTSLNYIVTPTF